MNLADEIDELHRRVGEAGLATDGWDSRQWLPPFVTTHALRAWVERGAIVAVTASREWPPVRADVTFEPLPEDEGRAPGWGLLCAALEQLADRVTYHWLSERPGRGIEGRLGPSVAGRLRRAAEDARHQGRLRELTAEGNPLPLEKWRHRCPCRRLTPESASRTIDMLHELGRRLCGEILRLGGDPGPVQEAHRQELLAKAKDASR